VVFDQIGGPEVLKIVDLPVTEPGDDEVRIRVHAIGINRADVMVRSGVYAWLPAFPQARLGIEATGVVDAVGAAVTDLKIGDDVLVVAVPHMDVDGVYAEYVNLPASTVIRRPAHIDAVGGAALWIVYAAAYGSLIEKASMRAGDHLLVTAASSAVGLAAIQVANQIGAVPIAVTVHATKRDSLLAQERPTSSSLTTRTSSRPPRPSRTVGALTSCSTPSPGPACPTGPEPSETVEPSW